MLWELEEKQIHEKHQLSKRSVKDICFMQRHQMIVRHEKELEQVKRMLQRKEEELIKRQTVERRALPKRIRNERKARDLMFRESLRISTNIEPDAEREKLKKVRQLVCILLFAYKPCVEYSSSKNKRRRGTHKSNNDLKRNMLSNWRNYVPQLKGQ